MNEYYYDNDYFSSQSQELDLFDIFTTGFSTIITIAVLGVFAFIIINMIIHKYKRYSSKKESNEEFERELSILENETAKEENNKSEKVKCEYCDSYVDIDEINCPNCGASLKK